MIESCIILIGFMGVGKTTIGQMLANKISVNFIDLDSQIEQAAGCRIAQIFALQGEDKFRQLETVALTQVDASIPSVISTGGGIIGLPENWQLMRRLGRVVYLHAQWSTLVARLVDTSNRPLAGDLTSKAAKPCTDDKLAQLWQSRLPLYRQADIIVNTDGLFAEQVVEQILLALENE